MLQRSDDVLAMSLRQIRHSRRQRAEQVFNAFGRFPIGRRSRLQKRFERHPDDIRRPAAQSAGGSPERTTELGGQPDRDLILHECLLLCTAIVVHRITTRKRAIVPHFCPLDCLWMRPVCNDRALHPDEDVGLGLPRRIERDLEPYLGKGWLKKP